jgi:hypothetical protein
MVVRCPVTAPRRGVRSCPSVDVGSRHCACRTGTLAPGASGHVVRTLWGLGAPRPLPGRSGALFDWSFTAGLCAAERDAVEGFPWPGRPRGWAQRGGRSPGLPLAAAVFLLGGDARYAALAPASRPARRAPQLRWVPALTPAPFAWAARRKQENHKLQRPAAYRPGERSARFSPPPLRRPWEAQPPLRVAAAHSPQKKPSGKVCLFLFLALRA